MEYLIQHPSFAGRGLKLRTGWGRPAIVADGQEAPRKWRTFTVRDNSGTDIEIKLIQNPFDVVPKVQIAGETIVLVEPLRWYEYAWVGVPALFLVHLGGAIGAALGVWSLYNGVGVFRSDRSMRWKYLISGAITSCAYTAVIVLQIILMLMIHGH
jgi:hypothetical protein